MISEVDLAFQNLHDHDSRVRKVAAQTLCRLLPRARIRELQTALITERDPNVARWIAFALGRIGDPSSLPILEALLARLTDADADARDWMLVSRRMVDPQWNKGPLKGLFASTDSEAVRTAVLQSYENTQVSKRIHNDLIRATEHSDPRVRRWAILSLGVTGRLSTSEPVLHGLQDGDYLVREWTACTLSRVKDPKALNFILLSLQDRNEHVRKWAIKALQQYDDTEIPRILMRMYVSEPDGGCREAIALVLGRWATSTAVGDFLKGFIVAETDRVVVAQLINSALSSAEGRSDLDLLALIVQRCGEDDLLWRETHFHIVQSLSESDRHMVGKFLGSPVLQFALGTAMRSEDQELHSPVPFQPSRFLNVNSRLLIGRGKAMVDEAEVTKVGIIIPLKEEFAYFSSVVPNIRPQRDKETNQPYYDFELPLADGKKAKCVAFFIGRMGTTVAAAFTERLLQNFRPDIVANLGIAASIDEDLRLGDVLVATEVDMYLEGAKAVTATGGLGLGFEIIPQGDPFKTDGALCEEFDHFEFRSRDAFLNWQASGAGEWDDLMKQEPSSQTVLETGSAGKSPRFLNGVLGSGPFLGAAVSFGEWLKTKFNRKYLGLDMEAGGVASAAHYGRFTPRTLVIRGVSDFGDERKKDLEKHLKGAVRGIAMRNATRLFMACLSTLDMDVLSAP